MPSRPRDRRGPARNLSRRRFLGLGAAGAGVVLLTSCGDDAQSTAAGDPTTTLTADAGALSLSQFIGPNTLLEKAPVRVPFGLADVDGLLPTEDSPESLEVSVRGPDAASEPITVEVERHDEGLPRAYYPLRWDAGPAGIYTASTELDGQQLEMAVQVQPAEDLTLIRAGQQLPAVQTPTKADHRGVTPICTREPTCPLHEVSLADALDEERPIALVLAAPAFCQIAVCGPVLDVVLDTMDGFDDVRFVHGEIYTDPFDNLDETTEVVQELSLHFEPVLILADASGRVVERIDTIFDRAEVRASLARLEGVGT